MFERNLSCVTIPNNEELQQYELWTEKTDINSLDQEMREIIRFCSEGTPRQRIEMYGFCARGLETRVKKNLVVAKRRQREARDAVFEESSAQSMEGVVNRRLIARKYALASQSSVDEAIRMAARDECEARQIYQQHLYLAQ